MALVPDTRAKSNFPTVEIGRDGKYGLMTDLAIPLCLGDFFGRFRVVGTTPAMFDELVYDIDNQRKFEFAQGRNFRSYDAEHGYFEAVVGATVAREMHVKLGQSLSPKHGDPEGATHSGGFTVVGILRTAGRPTIARDVAEAQGALEHAQHVQLAAGERFARTRCVEPLPQELLDGRQPGAHRAHALVVAVHAGAELLEQVMGCDQQAGGHRHAGRSEQVMDAAPRVLGGMSGGAFPDPC